MYVCLENKEVKDKRKDKVNSVTKLCNVLQLTGRW